MMMKKHDNGNNGHEFVDHDNDKYENDNDYVVIVLFVNHVGDKHDNDHINDNN